MADSSFTVPLASGELVHLDEFVASLHQVEDLETELERLNELLRGNMREASKASDLIVTERPKSAVATPRLQATVDQARRAIASGKHETAVTLVLQAKSEHAVPPTRTPERSNENLPGGVPSMGIPSMGTILPLDFESAPRQSAIQDLQNVQEELVRAMQRQFPAAKQPQQLFSLMEMFRRMEGCAAALDRYRSWRGEQLCALATASASWGSVTELCTELQKVAALDTVTFCEDDLAKLFAEYCTHVLQGLKHADVGGCQQLVSCLSEVVPGTLWDKPPMQEVLPQLGDTVHHKLVQLGQQQLAPPSSCLALSELLCPVPERYRKMGIQMTELPKMVLKGVCEFLTALESFGSIERCCLADAVLEAAATVLAVWAPSSLQGGDTRRSVHAFCSLLLMRASYCWLERRFAHAVGAVGAGMLARGHAALEAAVVHGLAGLHGVLAEELQMLVYPDLARTDWEASRQYSRSGLCGYGVQLWNLRLRRLEYDLSSAAPAMVADIVLAGYLASSLKLFGAHYEAATPARAQLSRWACEVHHVVGVARRALAGLADSPGWCEEAATLAQEASECADVLTMQLAVLSCPVEQLLGFFEGGGHAQAGGTELPPGGAAAWQSFEVLQEFQKVGTDSLGFEAGDFRLELDWDGLLKRSGCSEAQFARWAARRTELREGDFPPLDEEEQAVAEVLRERLGAYCRVNGVPMSGV